MFLFADNIVVFVEYPKKSTKIKFPISNKWVKKATEYTVNIKKTDFSLLARNILAQKLKHCSQEC
jgi:sulfur relay (sulfurtransferase) complex TusBCD TusD component (DsrE family)